MPAPAILVRRARPADAVDITRVMSHADVCGNLLQLPLPSEELWRSRIEAMGSSVGNDVLMVAEQGGQVVGSAGLHPQAQLRRRHAAMLGISVDPAAQGQGVGHALMQALCSYADDWAQILRLELTVFTDNARALALYRRFDFRLEGTHRAYALRNGVYADVHCMARLHPRPPVLSWPADTPGTPATA